MQFYKNMIMAGTALIAVVFALDVASDTQRSSGVNRVPLSAIDWPISRPTPSCRPSAGMRAM